MGNNDKIDRIDKKDKIDKMELNSALKEYMEAPLKIKGQQQEKKNPKVMLEPIAQMDHLERLERQNNSTSLPPPNMDNNYYKR